MAPLRWPLHFQIQYKTPQKQRRARLLARAGSPGPDPQRGYEHGEHSGIGGDVEEAELHPGFRIFTIGLWGRRVTREHQMVRGENGQQISRCLWRSDDAAPGPERTKGGCVSLLTMYRFLSPNQKTLSQENMYFRILV